MEERSITDTYVKESLIGIAAASFSIVVLMTLMEGGGRTAFVDSIMLLLFGYVAPFIFLPAAPWLIAVIALAGVVLYQQYRRVPPRFMRYIVGAEVIVWQVMSFQLIANLFTQ